MTNEVAQWLIDHATVTPHEHSWYTGSLDPDDPPVTICTRCGEYHDHAPIETGAALRRAGRKTCSCGVTITRRPGNSRRTGDWIPSDD